MAAESTDEFDISTWRHWSAFVRMWHSVACEYHRTPPATKRTNPYQNARAIIWASNHGEKP